MSTPDWVTGMLQGTAMAAEVRRGERLNARRTLLVLADSMESAGDERAARWLRECVQGLFPDVEPAVDAHGADHV